MSRKKKSVNLTTLSSEIVFNKFFGFKNKGFHFSDKLPYFIHNLEVLPDGSLIGRKKLKKVLLLKH